MYINFLQNVINLPEILVNLIFKKSSVESRAFKWISY